MLAGPDFLPVEAPRSGWILDMFYFYFGMEAMGMRQAMCVRNVSKAVVGLHLEAERSQHQPGGDQVAPQTERSGID